MPADNRTGNAARSPGSSSPGRSSISGVARTPKRARISRGGEPGLATTTMNRRPRWMGKMPAALSRPTIASTAPRSIEARPQRRGAFVRCEAPRQHQPNPSALARDGQRPLEKRLIEIEVSPVAGRVLTRLPEKRQHASRPIAGFVGRAAAVPAQHFPGRVADDRVETRAVARDAVLAVETRPRIPTASERTRASRPPRAPPRPSAARVPPAACDRDATRRPAPRRVRRATAGSFRRPARTIARTTDGRRHATARSATGLRRSATRAARARERRPRCRRGLPGAA